MNSIDSITLTNLETSLHGIIRRNVDFIKNNLDKIDGMMIGETTTVSRNQKIHHLHHFNYGLLRENNHYLNLYHDLVSTLKKLKKTLSDPHYFEKCEQHNISGAVNNFGIDLKVMHSFKTAQIRELFENTHVMISRVGDKLEYVVLN